MGGGRERYKKVFHSLLHRLTVTQELDGQSIWPEYNIIVHCALLLQRQRTEQVTVTIPCFAWSFLAMIMCALVEFIQHTTRAPPGRRGVKHRGAVIYTLVNASPTKRTEEISDVFSCHLFWKGHQEHMFPQHCSCAGMGDVRTHVPATL